MSLLVILKFKVGKTGDYTYQRSHRQRPNNESQNIVVIKCMRL